jgi:ABC-2 type transport system ATP-binding protein
MSTPTVEAYGLRKAFGEVQALDGLSLAVPAGSVLGLLGPNGSGKTTTVSILATSLRPDAGRSTVGGLDVVTEAAQVRRVIGLAGQFAAVDPNLTGRENLRLIGRLSRVGRRQEAAQAAHTALASAGYRPQRDGADIQVRYRFRRAHRHAARPARPGARPGVRRGARTHPGRRIPL